MQNILTAMLNDGGLEQMCGCFNRKKGQAFVYGMSGTQKHASFCACYRENPRTSVIITHSQQELQDWREDLSTLLPNVTIAELPILDMVDFSAAAKGLQQNARRMELMGRLLQREENLIVIATAQAVAQKGITPQLFKKLSLEVSVGKIIDRDEALKALMKMGYERVDQVENPGHFSVRGGLIDVFPITSSDPIRIEFFDDEVDSIRLFDSVSQLSVKKISEIEILPFNVFDDKHRSAFLTEFLQVDATIVMDDPLKVRDELVRLVKENPDYKGKVFSWADVLERLEKYNVIYMAMLMHSLHGIKLDSLIGVTVQGVTSYQRQMNLLLADMEDWLSRGQKVIIALGDKGKAESTRELLARNRLASVILAIGEVPRAGVVSIVQGGLLNGFELPDAKLVVITEKDIFGRQKKKLVRVSKEAKINHFREINVGDYVVHVQHGIGKYLGVKTEEIDGLKRDYLYIQYGGPDRLYVPTDQVELLQKYIGNDGEVPKLHRIGSTSWAKTKAKVQSSVKDIANELIKLYAERKKSSGFAYSADTLDQHNFEEDFPYEETQDQLIAIAEIKADMERQQPMDRLLCGDVGFGKTEVAIRAAFKAVMDGKQVAVLVPTTVLAQQHFQTFHERFKNTSVNIEVLNRFCSAKEQKEIIARVENGLVDILIGTHAILNTKKVKFRDLGFLIVDEEQRFGVKQKEKIKQIAVGIDVLTLSATPIPRTLHMSLAGARDMSVIETAPQERFPVQTYVVEDRDSLIVNAIHRELKRGGQIYFVYNRVESIARMWSRLHELVPEARIQVAHGQMPEAQLERAMVEFYEGSYDILLATSIIESGLDIANANTIIIYDADKFGLAQLYQMRGRVGRSKKMAYAYLLYRENKVLSEVAEKRLQAIKEFAELGAGFKIAMRDMEIRGAGNLLGSQQHGHIASVGFEMYCRLLDEAMQELKNGRPVKLEPEPLIAIRVEAYISSDYVGDAMHKIEIYHRIAALRSNEAVEALLEELIDRFGDPPQPVLNLLTVAKIRNLSRTIGVTRISEESTFLEFHLKDSPKIDPEAMVSLAGELKKNIRFVMQPHVIRINMEIVPRRIMQDFVLQILERLAG